jgi:hypothetical protein
MEDLSERKPAHKRPRLDDDDDHDDSDDLKDPIASLHPYHDVGLTRHSHAHLRIFILPNAWVCVRIYIDDSHLCKETTFSFPRMDHALMDESVLYELGEWNGEKRYNYDTISIALVLAKLEGDEKKLRDLKEIDLESQDDHVQRCLKHKNY